LRYCRDRWADPNWKFARPSVEQRARLAAISEQIAGAAKKYTSEERNELLLTAGWLDFVLGEKEAGAQHCAAITESSDLTASRKASLWLALDRSENANAVLDRSWARPGSHFFTIGVRAG